MSDDLRCFPSVRTAFGFHPDYLATYQTRGCPAVKNRENHVINKSCVVYTLKYTKISFYRNFRISKPIQLSVFLVKST